MEENLSNLGGGSGGDDDDSDDRGHQVVSADGTYEVRANQLSLFTWKNVPPSADKESRLTLAAIGGISGEFNDDGTVDIRGCKGVRITSGPFLMIPLLNPEMSSPSTDGIEIECGEAQSITIKRGLLSDIDQYISLTDNNITIDAGVTGTLTLAAGLSSITISADGITINGAPVVQINPGPPAPPPPPLPEDEPEPPDPDSAVA